MSGEITTFAALPVGTTFWCNGNVCRKVSTRTAKVGSYGVFYFGMSETCTLGWPGEV